MKRFLLAMIAVCGLACGGRADDYIVVVFDTSGSMGEYMRTARQSRMTVAQNALVEVLTQVPDTTKVGVVTFNGWIYDLAPVDRGRLEKAIRDASAGGGTPLYQFMKTGADRLLEERAKNVNVGSYKLLVVTDGEASDSKLNEDGSFSDGGFRPGVLRDIVSRGITVDAIGLEMGDGHSLKNQINGRYMRGDDPASLKQSLSKAVAEVGFNGNDALSESAFAEVGNLPEVFVKASIKGLTEYRNHPVGERPMVKVILEDGRVVERPEPGDPAAVAEGGGMSWWMVVLIILGVIFVTIIVLAGCSGNCN